MSKRQSSSHLPPILYEDDLLVAFDKPSGLLVTPDRYNHAMVNLMSLVHEHMSAEYFNMHRLDRDTSGVLLCGKTPESIQVLRQQFDTRQVRKVYTAITRGRPLEDQGLIDAPLAPDPKRPRLMRIRDDGKDSRTEYRMMEHWRGLYSLIEAQPHTGRTHQIRVHLAHAGCPIVCDELYGDGLGIFLSQIKRGYKRSADPEKPLIGRLALHAQRLEMTHPATGALLVIESPLPKEFQVALKYLRKFLG